MYLAIDVGGSKTLIAVFDPSGKIIEQYKIPTNKDYSAFIIDIKTVVEQKFSNKHFSACVCAMPGQMDRNEGLVYRFGNLPWKNVPVKKDLEKVLGYMPIYIENDAKLAGLAEAIKHSQYHKVLYLTVSTGIGDGFIVDGKIDPDLADSEPGQMMLEFEGKIQKWEDFASGRALVNRYGKKASEIDDPTVWREFSRGLARGMNELIATLQPEVIVIGGGVGAHFEKFSSYLNEELTKLENEMVKTPPIVKAENAEEAVIYGCYEFAKQKT